MESLGASNLLRHLIAKASTELQSTGQFNGNELHTTLNHSTICRLALEAIVEGNDSPCKLDSPAAAEEALKQLFGRLNDRGWAPLTQNRGIPYRIGPKKLGRFGLKKFAVDACWYPYLAKLHRNHSAKFEIARSYLFLRVYLEPCRTKLVGKYVEETRRSLPDSLNSAFSCMEYEAILNFVSMLSNGWIDDIAMSLQDSTISDWSDQFVRHYVVDAATWHSSAPKIEDWPMSGLESPFQHTPFIRLPTGAIVAPDPGLLFSGLSDRLLYRLLVSYEGEGEGDDADEWLRKIGPRLLGSIFEVHVGKLVEELAMYSPGSIFVPEFKHFDGTDSADAHLVEGDHLTFFEAKVTAVRRPLEKHAGLNGLFGWLDTVAGKNDRRGPLAQGVAQVGAWAKRDTEAVKVLGDPQTIRGVRYLIVAREEIPFIVHWEQFRNAVWRPRLGEDEKELFKATMFLSVRDLEAAVAILRHEHAAGKPRTFGALLNEWRKSLHASQGFWEDSQRRQGAGGLQDYIATCYPRATGEMPSFMRNALDAWFKDVAAAGFGEQKAERWTQRG